MAFTLRGCPVTSAAIHFKQVPLILFFHMYNETNDFNHAEVLCLGNDNVYET